MFSAMRTPLGCVLGLALAGLVLGACGDDDQPSTLPDVTPSTTSVESPGATPSGNPTAQLEAEITAFYEDYVNTINESFSSTVALKRRGEMFSESCGHCQEGYELAERANTDGLVLNGAVISVVRIDVDAISRERATFSVVSESSPGTLVTDAGDIVHEFPGSTNVRVTYQAQRTTRGWVIVSSQVLM